MGSVWVAEHLTLHTEVVVKFMSELLASDPASLARFSREAASAAQVKSPHVVQILDHGLSSTGHPFIVMELLEGKDLSHELKERPTLSPEETAHVVEHIARALGRAHERGILHRDIKPANIFLCDVGERWPFVKLLDFGIAKPIDDPSQVTSTGDQIGTPSYMSPEQVRGGALDHRTDLWSLGVVAFRALTGSLPFAGATAHAVAIAVATSPLPRPSSLRPDLPPAIDAWFARACSRDIAQRFQSAREMADCLWRAVGLPQNASGPSPSASSSALVRVQRPSEPTPGGEVAGNTVRGTAVTHARPAARKAGAVALVFGLCVLLGGLFAALIGRSSSREAREAQAAGLAATADRLRALAIASVEAARNATPPLPEASAEPALASASPTASPTARPAAKPPTPRARPGRPAAKQEEESDMGF
jgi:serine/threonine-protein kinase